MQEKAVQSEGRIPLPSKSDFIQWVQEANSHLNTQTNVTKKSFKVCVITNALDGKENGVIHCAQQLTDIHVVMPTLMSLIPFAAIQIKTVQHR
jgi:hypothetical protein